ncbi:MAG: thioredoxin-disulfide reductase [Dehalococcoidia bacterium]|nr:thioredoxin-disulfide reductase [Dehalococcoidia bacterium]
MTARAYRAEGEERVQDVDVAIIGGGPAGLAAGLYAARARRRSVLWEGALLGGQIAATGTIENYPGLPDGIEGPALVAAMHGQAERFGLETHYEAITALQREPPYYVLDTAAGRYRAKAVIVTAGATPNKLDVPGEAELTGKGVSYCATCDAAFFKGDEVAVIGGGDTALDEGLFAARFARRVHIIHRRSALRASALLQERARAQPKIDFTWNTIVTRVNGRDAVTSLSLQNVESAVASELAVSGVFVFIGQTPNSSLLDGLVPLDRGGHAYVNLWMETDRPGLFVAGDVRVAAARQLVSAAGDGATAAIRADHYIAERFDRGR